MEKKVMVKKKYNRFLQKQAMMLMQAMLGAISPNFRMVSIVLDKQLIKIKIILESKSDSDQQEIDEIAAEFEALQDSYLDYDIETVINNLDLKWPEPGTIVVYRRKEE